MRVAATFVLLILLVVGSGCQSEPPSTPTPLGRPEFPAAAPAGIPAVTGSGTLAIVDQAPNGAVSAIPVDLGQGWLATFLVPSFPATRLAVRIQALAAEPPIALPETSVVYLQGFSLELYDAATGEQLGADSAQLGFGIRPPTPIDPADLQMLWLHPAGGAYQQVPTAVDRDARALQGRLAPHVVAVVSAKRPAVPDIAPARASVPAPPTAEPTPPAVRYVRAPLPARLSIPRIAVDAPISPVGLEQSGIMASPQEGHVVGWYELGPRPGEPSNAVLAGHVDWQQKLAVFFRLHELRAGDVIDVQSSLGTRYRYVVEGVTTYRNDAAPLVEIFGRTPGPVLTLITCGGEFDRVRREYLDRVVVRARGA
jgi:LPXTG-site transpeptidase (sortase) family protein